MGITRPIGLYGGDDTIFEDIFLRKKAVPEKLKSFGVIPPSLFQEFINMRISILQQAFKFTSIIIINNVKSHANST